MKNIYHICRLVLTFIVGSFIVYKTYQFKYADGVFNGMVYWGIILLGLIIWGIFLRIDLALYDERHQKKYLLGGIMGAVTLVIAIATYWKINRDFNKPSLIEAFYDGGFNGVGLDFKKNGTYIFDNFCMWSDYKYGTYNINGDIIELDDNVLNDLHISNRLKIMTVKDSLKDTVMLNKYIFQMDDHWNETKNVIKFRVTVDNR